jgi:hypothetical protein
MNKVVLDGKVRCPVKPRHINTKERFWDAFGNSQTEVSANHIVRLCQKKGGWCPFTQKEIDDYYRSMGHGDGFTFNHLIDDGWVVEDTDVYRVTLQFVARVWASSPVI